MEIFGKREVPPRDSFQKPSEPVSVPKGPFEKRGGIPREKFSGLFKKGPYSLPWSRGKGKERLKKMGEEVLRERFPGYYGGDISGSEIQREVGRLKVARGTARTQAERDRFQEQIVRLEEVKKRAGL